MLRYEIYRPKLPMESITTKKFIPGSDICEIMGGNYVNVSHIKKFHDMCPKNAQILVRDGSPENDNEEQNELFSKQKGTVVIIKGLYDVR